MNEIRVIQVVDGPVLAQAGDLIREYGESIAHVAACSLEHQRFDEEVASLPGKFALPRGRLLVAMVGRGGQEAGGCIALRPLDELGPRVCEMKRMYVRPAYRGMGIGRVLAARLIEEAKGAGYELMKLDTASQPVFAAAIALYRSLGFAECERYNADPDPASLWFELKLK